MKELRQYQRESIDSVYSYWRNGGVDPCLIVIPTGGGKSLVMAQMIREIVEDFSARVILLSHIKELISQNFDEIVELWPEAPIGIFSASLKRKEIQAPILVAGIQSIEKHVHKLDPAPEIVLIDECHLMSTTDGSRYKRAMATLKAMYPKLRVVGLSATPYRMDRGWLHKGEGAFFGSIVYDAKIQSLIDDGYLAQLVVKAGKATISTDGLHKQGKEWKAGELEARAMEGDVTRIAVEDMITRGADRKKWLIFAAGKLHAKQILDELEAHGIPAGMVLGDTAHGEREALVSGHKYGEIKALVTINVLSTGYNNPSIDLLALMRPTESASLYVQQVGRGSRIAPGKVDCLVLDYSGVVVRHGPIDAIDPERKPGNGDGVAPAKVCPDCEAVIAAGLRHCPYCGYEFPPPALKIQRKPTEAPILKSQIMPEYHAVERTTWALHKKPGSRDSVRVTYHLPGDMGYNFIEWIFPETENQRGQFCFWAWCKESGAKQAPTAELMVQGEAPQARGIYTKKEGKYHKVVKREWQHENL
jgi:DNA repair protein RadD